MTNQQASRRTAAFSVLRRCAAAAVTVTCAVTAVTAAARAAPSATAGGGAAAGAPVQGRAAAGGAAVGAAVPGRAAAAAAAGGEVLAPAAGKLTAAQRTVLVEATRRYRDVDRALAAGYLATDLCVPGMGWHYVNPGLAADPAIDAVWPEVLLYVPGSDGEARLVGIEYFKADTDGSLKTDDDRPTLFGQPFDGPMAGHAVPAGAPPMPVHYDLHVWLYLDNPDGVLATENPRITCS
jgi:hypothetical protein